MIDDLALVISGVRMHCNDLVPGPATWALRLQAGLSDTALLSTVPVGHDSSIKAARTIVEAASSICFRQSRTSC